MSAISIPKEHTKTLCLVKMLSLSIVEKPFHHVFSGRGWGVGLELNMKY